MHRPISLVRNRARTLMLIVASVAMVFGNIASISAAALDTASLTLGDPRSSETTTYTVAANGFTTATTIRCIEVDLDTQADGAGGNPTSDTTSSTLDSSTLITPASWSVDNTTDGTLRITSVAGETPAASGNVIWGAVDNGATEGTTYYAILSSYTDTGCSSAVVDSVTMAFVYKDGELVTLTIDPTLTFTCSAVGIVAETVNGATVNTASTGTGIDYLPAVVTSANNGISAHDLNVTTNASGGYNVYIRHTALLTNANSDTIPASAGTNAVPLAFTAAGTEGWGYTTEDTDLAQFQPNLWAGFNSSNELVMTNAAATAGTDTERVGHQVGIATDTPAGTYQTTIIYTVVATY